MATFRGVHRQPQFFGLTGDEVYVTGDNEELVLEESLQSCQRLWF